MIAGDGRAFRFLALVAAGWVSLRMAMVWYATGSLPQAVQEVLPIPRVAIAASTAPVRSPIAAVDAAYRAPSPGVTASPTTPEPTFGATAPDPAPARPASLATARFAGSLPDAPGAAATVSPVQRGDALVTLAGTASGRRLSVSSWMIARGGTGLGATLLAPQLGGTQGGIRMDYALTRGVAATARIAAPAAGAGREMSIGVAWRPAGVPLRFVAEQRVALDGGRGGPALGVSGGVSELRLPADFRLEGYGQAGAIVRDGIERYIDASVRAARPVGDAAGVTLDIGGGLWGGAQRGVARLDIGPSVGAQVPLGDRRLRISLDWRQRVAGNARPGSGPALSLGTDF